MERVGLVLVTGLVLLLAGGCQDHGPAPEAAFDYEPKVGEIPLTVTFDASASTGRIAMYSWEFGDGTTGRGTTVEHTFTEPGRYLVQLTVRDGRGREDTAEGEVLAHPPTPAPPG